MSVKETILGLLADAKGQSMCDDCLATEALLAQRQSANAACRTLSSQGRIGRDQGRCHLCGKYKLVNWLGFHPQRPAERPKYVKTASGTRPSTPRESISTDDLMRLRRQVVQLVALLDKTTAREALAKRISRLVKTRLLPRNVEILMRSITDFRNLAEYEGYQVTPEEARVIWNAAFGLQKWASGRGFHFEVPIEAWSPGKGPETKPEPPAILSEGEECLFAGVPFHRVGRIEPERDATGRVQLFYPGRKSAGSQSANLHRYGIGPFCRFRIAPDLKRQGVYLLAIDDLCQYVGRCQDLSWRFNAGYGRISPANCNLGGQQTNCRLNKLILQSALEGDIVELWFHESGEPAKVEALLISSLRPTWNR